MQIQDLKTKDIAKMDGPAFHKAADIITNLKENNLLFDIFVDNEI